MLRSDRTTTAREVTGTGCTWYRAASYLRSADPRSRTAPTLLGRLWRFTYPVPTANAESAARRSNRQVAPKAGCKDDAGSSQLDGCGHVSVTSRGATSPPCWTRSKTPPRGAGTPPRTSATAGPSPSWLTTSATTGTAASERHRTTFPTSSRRLRPTRPANCSGIPTTWTSSRWNRITANATARMPLSLASPTSWPSWGPVSRSSAAVQAARRPHRLLHRPVVLSPGSTASSPSRSRRSPRSRNTSGNRTSTCQRGRSPAAPDPAR